jgi:hypothetical protein
MKKNIIKLFSLLILVILIGSFVSFPQATFAQTATQIEPAPQPTGSLWVVDPEVTFIGKNAARSGLMLDWTLQNYQWVCVTTTSVTKANESHKTACDNSKNPLAGFWLIIVSYIVVPLLFIVILATAIVIIVTRGRSLTIMRFLPRFVAVIILIFFSFGILQFFYQFFDMIQGFFLQSMNKPCPPDCISQKDLLYVGWDYTQFIGLRLLGDYNAESAFISLLLTKLTALTYFVMVGILLMRKIILWFFIIVSPIFPLLLMYYPTRNTGKIWIGEFFRWLLYAPLFAIFLKGLVYMWRQQIPLNFIPNDSRTIGTAKDIVFPTAVNILLGGPRQFVTPTNSVNLKETFALYVVALIMLWIVILLPWILLQIFLDYASNFSPGDSAVMKTLVNLATNKPVVPVAPTGSSPTQPGGGGVALPFAKFSSKMKVPVSVNPEFKPAGAAKEIGTESAQQSVSFTQPMYMPNAQVNVKVLSLANVPLPTMRDIAKYDTALHSNDTSKQKEVSQLSQTLEKIANPVAVTSTAERDQFREIRENLMQQSQQGNVLATSILSAATTASRNATQKNVKISTSDLKNVLQQIANPASTPSGVDRARMSQVHDMLQKESKENNNALASSILSVNEKTSTSDMEKLKEQLESSQKSSISSSILSTVSSAQTASTSELRSMLQQIANPSSVTNSADRERFTQLHDMMQKESKENNNQLASSILSVSDKTSSTELESIKDQLAQGQTQANSVASTINNTAQSTQIKKVLQQIANPSSASNPVDRERFSKMHDMLQKESKENNNQLATSILSVNDSTSLTELEKIHDSIMQSKDSTIASTVLSTVSNAIQQTQATTHVKSVLQQVANPASATAIDREKLTRLNTSLTKASKEGNELASSILSVSEKTSSADIEKLQERIKEAKERGDSSVAEIASMTQQAVSLPAMNRVQNVSKEDFDEVKQMWKENYKKLEVPEGMAGTRSEWIKDDIGKIDNVIGLLTSNDQEKVSQGIEQVSDILPFLLVGGFSQTEIVSYLQAKQAAAKEVQGEISTEEEEKVSVGVQKVEVQKTMSATMEQGTGSVTNVTNEGSISTPSYTTTSIVTPQVSNEILAMVNLKMPKMRDIARYETGSLRKDQSQITERTRIHDVLSKIANPKPIEIGIEREKYEKLRERLFEESQKGDVAAHVILSAAHKMTTEPGIITATLGDIKVVLQNIADPSLVSESDDRDLYTHIREDLQKDQSESYARDILAVNEQTPLTQIDVIRSEILDLKEKTTPLIETFNSFVETKELKELVEHIVDPSFLVSKVDREHFTKLHDDLLSASKEGNTLAESILSVNKATPMKEIKNLAGKLKDANKSGDKIAQQVLSASHVFSVPVVNVGQPVDDEDYDEVRKMWEDTYRKLPVPLPFTEDNKGRIEWIKSDISQIEETLALLTSSDLDKRNEGLKKVSEILPFILLGGYSFQEMVKYLNVKLTAAKTVLNELSKEENSLESIEVAQPKNEETKEMAASEEDKNS